MWWPGITRDIKHVVGACDHCQVHKPIQQMEPLMTRTLAESSGRPLFVSRKDFMVVVDYYSIWIEILQLSNTTSAAYIAKLKDIFARFGIPIELVSDNAPQLSSSYVKSFAEQYGFTLVTSNSYLSNANGKAKRSLQTAKRIIIQDDHWLSLMGHCDRRHGIQS